MKRRSRTRELIKEAFKRGYKKALKEAFRDFGTNFKGDYCIPKMVDELRHMMERAYNYQPKSFEEYCQDLKTIIQDEHVSFYWMAFDYFKTYIQKIASNGVNKRNGKNHAYLALVRVVNRLLAGRYYKFDELIKISRGGKSRQFWDTADSLLDDVSINGERNVTANEIEDSPRFGDLLDDIIICINHSIGMAIHRVSEYRSSNVFGQIEDMDLDTLDYEIRKTIWNEIIKDANEQTS